MSIIEKAVEHLTKKTEIPAEIVPAPRDGVLVHEDPVNGGSPGVPLITPIRDDDDENERGDLGPAHDESPAHFVSIDVNRLHDKGFVTPGRSSATKMAQDLQLIKRRILTKMEDLRARGEPAGNMILVTSSIPREGKSFFSLNIALSAAMELDYTVLLVDADAAKNDVSNVLSIEAKIGLTDLLADDQLRLSEALIKTNIGNFAILPAGQRLPNTSELLASDHALSLFQDIANQNKDRLVILDGPPLLATSDASVLSSLVGQVVVVAEAGRITEAQLEESLSRLDHSKSIGLVLNKIKEGPRNHHYDSYY
jgi:exopolysaccharide/PEP-CTERM locus tyrosine autokinase